jgi:hypothetical protein
MHLMVDAFSHAPRVKLDEEGYMGLDVTGHRPDPVVSEETDRLRNEKPAPERDLQQPQ